MIPKTLHNKLKKLKTTLDKQNLKVKKKQYEYESLSNLAFTTQNKIDYIEGSSAVKTQILYNQGRDGKYIYGQVYYFIHPTSRDKKSYRFLISKTKDKLSRKKLEKLCMDKFYEKVIKENI